MASNLLFQVKYLIASTKRFDKLIWRFFPVVSHVVFNFSWQNLSAGKSIFKKSFELKLKISTTY